MLEDLTLLGGIFVLYSVKSDCLSVKKLILFAGLQIALASIPFTSTMKVDRPFYFKIVHRSSRLVLFDGHVQEPKN